MGWFDEQIRERKQSDQEQFEDSFLRVASAVMGRREASRLDDERSVARAAIDEILMYYHYKPREVPETVDGWEEQLEYQLRPHGLMYRDVCLEEGWYRDAYGPMLGRFRDSGKPVALLPSGLAGYRFLDRDSGRTRRVDARSQRLFEKEAVCFYRPLPQRKIGVPDLIAYMKNCLQLQDIILIALSTLAVTLVGMLMTLLMRVLTGSVVERGSVQMLFACAVFLACAVVSSQALGTVRRLAVTRISIKTEMSVEAAMMMRLLSLPADFFKRWSAGELSSRAQSVNQLCTLLLDAVMTTGLGSLASLLYITQIFAFTPRLVVPALAVTGVTVAFSLISTFSQMRIAREMMDCGAKEAGMSYALISGIRKIRLSGAEKRAFARWARLYSREAQLSYNPPLFLKLNSVIMMGVSLAGTIVMYYFAASSHVAPADYFAFNAAYGAVSGAFSSLAGIALSAARIRPMLEMAEPFLDAEPEASEDREAVSRLSGGIELNNVRFRYDAAMPWVIDGMDLKIRPGEYVAIVGRTGCGKSTLLRLLLGFERPERGSVSYDGRDISRLDLKSLRRKIGVVMQNGALVQGSIFENIAISAPRLTLDEAWRAAEIAGIADDIRAMPMGMQTLISEGQGGISGGQRQRLMIARAVAPSPRILMLDEATSALDNRTQRQVSEALDGLKCTRIVIAHRLSTIKNCDRIIVLEDGKIAEDGTYAQLLEKGGVFAELVKRQRLDCESAK